MHGWNPFDWGAIEFLALYGVMIGIAFIAGSAIAGWLRPEGDRHFVKDPLEVAYLDGGVLRLAEAVAGGMIVAGTLAVEGRNRLVTGAYPATSTVEERAVLECASPMRWRQVISALGDTAQRLDTSLVSRGLLMSKGEGVQIRLLQALPFVIVMSFGWVRYKLGVLRGEDVGFLVAAMALAAILAIWRFLRHDRRTRAALAELASLRARHDRLRRAPRSEEAGLAIALFGTGVLIGSPFAAFHLMRHSGSSGGSGSDGGNSGCGGGGCGGCGD